MPTRGTAWSTVVCGSLTVCVLCFLFTVGIPILITGIVLLATEARDGFRNAGVVLLVIALLLIVAGLVLATLTVVCAINDTHPTVSAATDRATPAGDTVIVAAGQSSPYYGPAPIVQQGLLHGPPPPSVLCYPVPATLDRPPPYSELADRESAYPGESRPPPYSGIPEPASAYTQRYVQFTPQVDNNAG